MPKRFEAGLPSKVIALDSSEGLGIRHSAEDEKLSQTRLAEMLSSKTRVGKKRREFIKANRYRIREALRLAKGN